MPSKPLKATNGDHFEYLRLHGLDNKHAKKIFLATQFHGNVIDVR